MKKGYFVVLYLKVSFDFRVRQVLPQSSQGLLMKKIAESAIKSSWVEWKTTLSLRAYWVWITIQGKQVSPFNVGNVLSEEAEFRIAALLRVWISTVALNFICHDTDHAFYPACKLFDCRTPQFFIRNSKVVNRGMACISRCDCGWPLHVSFGCSHSQRAWFIQQSIQPRDLLLRNNLVRGVVLLSNLGCLKLNLGEDVGGSGSCNRNTVSTAQNFEFKFGLFTVSRGHRHGL